MILKIIFLIMLCIPIACFISYLIIDTAIDLKNSKRTRKRRNKSISKDESSKKRHLRVAK
ncbi:hypothetical protein FQB35_14615 [Crassaminicella thermophila]|uniref:Uncharacterized protein n=1 Tax=Crassaminicella thermophila TaxID=2599308 RepID=A0A5C0SFS3_CRATE|nr:hypothetical protein [Crassaminicella thermophila]QEK13405.1 hypothetical protein FQB35_14615 [Crassaminicella thermophila]